MSDRPKVLMVYTGGTIGMLPKEENNPASPLVPADWKRLKKFAPALAQLPVEVELKEMKLIDSSDMYPDYWVDIARAIQERYEDFEGFVVLHGTDTMTYSATGLSFLLENLSKPVILTGSQISISEARNDAMQNLVTALMLAAPSASGLPVIPEVCILFGNKLLRGNRARKVSSSGFEGFATPNYDVLGEVGEHIKINEKVIRGASEEGFFINEVLEQNVMMFDIFPGIKPAILRRIFSIDDLRGVVFRTYGAGNAPTDPDFLAEIEKAVKNGIAVVNVTQCNQGMVEMGLYDASATLQRIGAISGVDMTPEAALVKLMFLLGQGYDVEMVNDLMQKDQRGEQSVNVYNFLYDGASAEAVWKAPAKQVPAGFDKTVIEAANIRLEGVSLPKGVTDADIDLAVFMNFPSADAATDLTIPQCLGHVKRAYSGDAENVILNVAERFARVVDPKRPIQLTLVSRNDMQVRWDGAFLSVYTTVQK